MYPWLNDEYPVDWNTELPVFPVHLLLKKSAENYPNNIAIDFKDYQISYDNLWQKVQHFAGGLAKIGVKKGTRIALFMPNCPQFIISYYAILYLGGIVVNCNPLSSANEIKIQLKDADCAFIITLSLKQLYIKIPQNIQVIMSDLGEYLPNFKNFLFHLFKKNEIINPPEKSYKFCQLIQENAIGPAIINPLNDVAILQYTGGTTGTPKGVMLTHANLTCNVEQAQIWLGEIPANEKAENSILAILPFFHIFAMTVSMNFAIASAIKIIIHSRFNVRDLLQDIDKKHPAFMPAVPTIYNAILADKNLHKYNLTSLKMCISGGAPLPLQLLQDFEEKTGCSLVEGYGLSEASPIVAVNPINGTKRENSVGLPLPQTIIKIINLENKISEMPLGESGEICIAAPQIMSGYWKNKTATDEVMQGKILHTGDIGYMDNDGYLYIIDRLKEMIISGGYNIYPRNIEEILYRHNAILEAAVISIPHDMRGQVPKAFIVLHSNATTNKAEIIRYLKENLASYAIPKEIEFRNKLPKSIIGKILKKELK